ncbi:MAG: DUF3996 domain-containing protein [Bdellovibrionia bacterium]
MKNLCGWKKILKSMMLLTLVCLMPAQEARADRLSEGSKAIGFMLGNPMGLTGKLWREDNRAIDMGISLSSDNFFLVYADYLFHFPGLFGDSSGFVEQLKPYIGVGAELSFARDGSRIGSRAGSSSTGIGLRVPLGVEWVVPDAPFGIFVEIAPVLVFAPSGYTLVEGSVGARWYF